MTMFNTMTPGAKPHDIKWPSIIGMVGLCLFLATFVAILFNQISSTDGIINSFPRFSFLWILTAISFYAFGVGLVPGQGISDFFKTVFPVVLPVIAKNFISVFFRPFRYTGRNSNSVFLSIDGFAITALSVAPRLPAQFSHSEFICILRSFAGGACYHAPIIANS